MSDGSLGYGNIENNPIYNFNSAPEEIKYKWNYLFGNLSKDKREQILMDKVSTFSITNYKTADKISDILLSLKGINTNSTILDGTACVGGNTISFAKKGFNVISVELDKQRSELLSHNIKLYNLENKIKIYNKNLLEIYKRFKLDILFIDPPWGGIEYINEEYIDLYLGDLEISELCFKIKNYTKYIAIKTPTNFDYNKFKTKILEFNNHTKKFKFIIKKPIILKKMLLIIIYIQRL
jgi:predicted RNA methylase